MITGPVTFCHPCTKKNHLDTHNTSGNQFNLTAVVAKDTNSPPNSPLMKSTRRVMKKLFHRDPALTVRNACSYTNNTLIKVLCILLDQLITISQFKMIQKLQWKKNEKVQFNQFNLRPEMKFAGTEIVRRRRGVLIH